MGSVASHMEDEESSGYETPPRPTNHQRILEFDPRSPSATIDRTPILVEKTPMAFLDPRSPTPGIWRTPITTVIEKVLGRDTKESSDLGVRAISSEEQDEQAGVRENIDTLAHLSIQEDTGDSIPLIEPKGLKFDANLVESMLHPKTEKPITAKKKLSMVQPKDIRSPLGLRNVDKNSPLLIVQRRQAKKIVSIKQCKVDVYPSDSSCRDSPPSQDKENINA